MGGLWRRENDAKDVIMKPIDISQVSSNALVPLVSYDDPESYGKLTMNRGPVEHIIQTIRDIEEQYEVVKVEVYFV